MAFNSIRLTSWLDEYGILVVVLLHNKQRTAFFRTQNICGQEMDRQAKIGKQTTAQNLLAKKEEEERKNKNTIK